MHGYYYTQNCELYDDTMCSTKVCMPACYYAQNYELCDDIVCNTKVCTHACSSTQNYELCDDTMCNTKVCTHACYSTQNYIRALFNAHGSGVPSMNPYTPRYFNTKYLEAKGLPVLANGDIAPTNNDREKYSTTSSLNKGSPSSEVHVSRMPKLHSVKTD